MEATMSILDGIELGIGNWAWGDSRFWGNEPHKEDNARQAFQTSLESGIRFFDTAETYGWHKAERLLGQFMRETDQSVIVATKFMPLPWRDLSKALRASLQRLGLPQVDLYQIHWPLPFRPIEMWMEGLADAVEGGWTRAVGVSNYNVDQTRRAYEALAKRGIPLASNQVEYSLLSRQIERNGLIDFCRDHNIKIIAYSPLGQGLLTGKYTPDNPPKGLARRQKSSKHLDTIQPLIGLMREIGEAHGGKTPAQVALNWTICKGTLPIPGAKNAKQASQNAGALGWRLSPDQIAVLDRVSDGL
jgi:aryl-alcohol dehydrogenase-like predicted oxidoreductase